ncbi:MAG: ECF transporter S component [Paramuribaculum sp.]|nr:ECF transporter S component [Paramuribaculum sp.]
MNQSVTLRKSYTFNDYRTYILATLFIAGNIILPQICHLVPQGGLVFLPIYFFTLIGALVFGWQVGLLTALLSPLANHLLFAMPPLAMLPVIEVKSVILALVAGVAMARVAKLNFAAVVAIVLGSQILGSIFELAWTGSMATAMGDFRIGLPGICIQIVAGCLCLRILSRKNH